MAPLALFLGACGAVLDDSDDQAATTPPNPLVFEITNAEGQLEGWMLGTIHALPDDVSWRTKATQTAIGKSDFLMVEVADLSDRKGIASILARLSTSKGLPALRERVSPKHRKGLDELLERSRFSSSDFRSTETWAAALMLAQVGAVGDPANGVDRAVIKDFAGRDIREFEGAEAQLRIFDELPKADQSDLLEGVIEETLADGNQAEKLREAWLAGDVAALERATSTGIMADPQLRRALLVERNEDWAEALGEILAEPEKPLVAVGAAHLVGPDGLPAILEKQGYSANRIK